MVAMRSQNVPSTRRLLPAFIVGWVSGIRIRVGLQSLEHNPSPNLAQQGTLRYPFLGPGPSSRYACQRIISSNGHRVPDRWDPMIITMSVAPESLGDSQNRVETLVRVPDHYIVL